MRVRKDLPIAAVLAVILLTGVCVSAQERAAQATECIDIKNFGRVNENLFRGAQPKGEDFAMLAKHGIKTIIDLQRKGEEDEQRLVEAAGMKFFRIGMSDSEEPAREQIEEFLSLLNDQSNYPIFVHCRGGRHRTGALIAIYRMVHEGWSADQAFQEMKHYDFNRGFGHGALKDTVYEYYESLGQRATASSSSSGR